MLNSIIAERYAHNKYELGNKFSDNKENFLKVIMRLENDITDGIWHKESYANIDIEMMPAMIARANKKYPDFHLNILNNPCDLGGLIDDMMSQGKQSFRCITNAGEDGIHFAVLDGRFINNKLSLVLFDSSNEKLLATNLLGFRLMLVLSRHSLPEYSFSMFAINIQRSLSECGIFSLALAKKLHRESQQIEKIHQDNILGKFKKQRGFIPYCEIDGYLPPSFFKYAQSINRLNEYIKTHSKSNDNRDKKRYSNIIERFLKNLVSVDNKKMSVSLHKKRIAEYRALMKT